MQHLSKSCHFWSFSPSDWVQHRRTPYTASIRSNIVAVFFPLRISELILFIIIKSWRSLASTTANGGPAVLLCLMPEKVVSETKSLSAVWIAAQMWRLVYDVRIVWRGFESSQGRCRHSLTSPHARCSSTPHCMLQHARSILIHYRSFSTQCGLVEAPPIYVPFPLMSMGVMSPIAINIKCHIGWHGVQQLHCSSCYWHFNPFWSTVPRNGTIWRQENCLGLERVKHYPFYCTTKSSLHQSHVPQGFHVNESKLFRKLLIPLACKWLLL